MRDDELRMLTQDELLEQIVDGRTDRVFDFLAAGHAATSTDVNGTTLIGWCTYHGDVSAVRYLLAHGESLETLGENLDLNAAAFHGHWQLCQFLIDSGADPNQALSNTGETPLHSALSKANRPHHDFVVEILLAGGADPNVATKPDKATGAFMRDCRTKAESPLHRAAAFGSESSIRMLLDAGGLRDARDMNGDSPLSWASWHLRPSPILRMLSYGKHLIHKDHNASYDHGRGWEQQRGKPHT